MNLSVMDTMVMVYSISTGDGVATMMVFLLSGRQIPKEAVLEVATLQMVILQSSVLSSVYKNLRE